MENGCKYPNDGSFYSPFCSSYPKDYRYPSPPRESVSPHNSQPSKPPNPNPPINLPPINISSETKKYN